MGMIQEMEELMRVTFRCMEEDVEYFSNTVIYEIQTENGKGVILNIKSLFKEEVPLQLICMKLVHNISMLRAFSLKIICDSGENVGQKKLKESDRFYLKISVSPENVNIDERKGFGLIFYKNSDMLLTLAELPDAIVNYVENLIKEKPKYNELTRALEFVKRLPLTDINAAMGQFIQKNKDFFKEYLSGPNFEG